MLLPSSTSPGSTTACTCSDSAYAHRLYAGSIVQKATRMYLVRIELLGHTGWQGVGVRAGVGVRSGFGLGLGLELRQAQAYSQA